MIQEMQNDNHAALTIRNLRLNRGTREILKGVDVDVASGEVCVLMGASGAGKSTILRTVAALEPFHEGRIEIGDFALTPGPLPPQSSLKPLRKRVGMVFQMHALFEHVDVVHNITLAPMHVHGMTHEASAKKAQDLLDELGISHRASAYPRQLSGGEAQRVAIARALAVDPQILLMDEPTAALDPARRGALGELLRSLAKAGRALLIATHDVDFARNFADRVVALDQGLVSGTTLA
jgi:ABC-type polar amino acid transport system ATPase subunit